MSYSRVLCVKVFLMYPSKHILYPFCFITPDLSRQMLSVLSSQNFGLVIITLFKTYTVQTKIFNINATK